ncbi:hypothetical protein BPJM79_40094 [Bacillus pumilus]
MYSCFIRTSLYSNDNFIKVYHTEKGPDNPAVNFFTKTVSN